MDKGRKKLSPLSIIFYYWFIMETNRLKQFCVVYETRNLRKAAELLNMSHSALSKSLKVLQSELDLQLLDQQGRNIVVTKAGHEFVLKARALLELEKKILLRTPEVAPVFRIGSFESFSTHALGMRWGKYFSDQALQINELSSGQLEQAVAENRIDAAITYEPIPTKDLEFIFLGKVTMGIYHRKGEFKNMEFEQLPFVAPLIPMVGTPSSAKGLDGWPEHELPRNVQYRVDLMESGLALVRSGLAAIFIPDFVARAQNEALSSAYSLVERAYPSSLKKIDRRVFLICRTGDQKQDRIASLKALLKQECI
jgi:DNA-binding transcriptional LysR family regulator